MIDTYVHRLFKFSGAGNDFVVLDGRKADAGAFREPERIGQLCREFGTDGLMILDDAPGLDFSMEFFNPDGSGGMMCGNGGRCIVAFANYLGIKPADGSVYRFQAPDGLHSAEILEYSKEGADGCGPQVSSAKDFHRWTVRLQMIDTKEYRPCKEGWFLNTGTRHYVQFVPDVDALDMDVCARPIRHDAEFQPIGTNVNFVEQRADGLHVRTFEKGVEGETLACGTGLTASAIAAFLAGIGPAGKYPADEKSGIGTDVSEGTPDNSTTGRITYRLQCRRGDWLTVDFLPGNGTFSSIHLTGPAELISVTRN